MGINSIGSIPINNNTNASVNKAKDTSFEERLQKAYDTNDDKELKKVCQDFEGILMNIMYKQMKATVPKSELIQADSGREIFESMMDDKLVEEASQSGKLGLADMLYKQMSKKFDSTYKVTTPSSKAIDIEPHKD